MTTPLSLTLATIGSASGWDATGYFTIDPHDGGCASVVLATTAPAMVTRASRTWAAAHVLDEPPCLFWGAAALVGWAGVVGVMPACVHAAAAAVSLCSSQSLGVGANYSIPAQRLQQHDHPASLRTLCAYTRFVASLVASLGCHFN